LKNIPLNGILGCKVGDEGNPINEPARLVEKVTIYFAWCPHYFGRNK